MTLTLIQGGLAESRRPLLCNALIGYTGLASGIKRAVYCHGKGYGETDYVDINGHWRKRVVVCPECGG